MIPSSLVLRSMITGVGFACIVGLVDDASSGLELGRTALAGVVFGVLFFVVLRRREGGRDRRRD